MRKNVFGRQFKRTKNQRAALFKGLLRSLILHGKIITTEEKAKSIKGDADKIITTAKKGEIEAKRLLSPLLPKDAVEKVIVFSKSFDKRNGGYTRIIRLGRRFSDSASMASLEWTERNKTQNKSVEAQKEEKNVEPKAKSEDKKEIKNPRKRAAKKEIKKNE